VLSLSPEGRDIELSVSPKDIPTSPHDLARTARIDDNLGRGTDGSNQRGVTRVAIHGRRTKAEDAVALVPHQMARISIVE
jgi:hypothetical protein